MRIFFLVFGLLLLVLASGSVYFFGKDYIVERVSIHKFSQDVTYLQRLKVQGSKVTDCYQDSSIAENMPNGYQLRFTSDTEYVIESVCMYPVINNLIIKEGALHGGMKRVFGSGIHVVSDTYDQGDAWVQLQYLDKTLYVGLFDDKFTIKTTLPDTNIGGDNPATANCSDWGFSCCNQTNAIASGSQVPALDCTKTCYQYCRQKPTILFFNTNPLMNSSSRLLSLRGSTNKVEFGYQIQDNDKSIQRVLIDFGDGKQIQSSELSQDNLVHTYTCSQPQCTYIAKITVFGNGELSLTDTTTNQVKIVVNR